MPNRHLMRGYTAGKKGLKRVFSRNRTLRTTLGPKARKEALNTLRGFKSGGGITARELSKSYGKWTRDTKDNITRAQAKVIRRELEEYSEQPTSEPLNKKEDARSHLEQVRSGNIRHPRFNDTPPATDTRAYLNKLKDRPNEYNEPKASNRFSQDNQSHRPDNSDDELHEPLF